MLSYQCMADSKFYGVTWSDCSGKWRATINNGGKQTHLGVFENEEDAARAYDAAAVSAPGRRRRLNFPPTPVVPAGAALIQLPGGWAVVDEADHESLSAFHWSLCGGYAYRTDAVLGSVSMHKQVLGFPSEFVDHVDLDRLNNRRANLRLATSSQNGVNKRKQRGSFTSAYKGVSWHKQHRKWYAQVSYEGRITFLGLFLSEVEAAAAYDRAARELHGQFALVNGVV